MTTGRAFTLRCLADLPQKKCWTIAEYLRSFRLPPASEAVLGSVGSLPGPVAVADEAGPTGFGLARALEQVGACCVVMAPSKLERPPGDRVKTYRRDAQRLARLLHIGELPGVRVPTVARRRRGIWSGPGRMQVGI